MGSTQSTWGTSHQPLQHQKSTSLSNMQATFNDAAPTHNKSVEETMKDEQARLEENKQRAAEGKPQIPGMAKREGAADISPEAHNSAERASNNFGDANAPTKNPLQ